MRWLCVVVALTLSGCAPVVGAWAGGTTAALSARYQRTEAVFLGMGIGAIAGWTIKYLTGER